MCELLLTMHCNERFTDNPMENNLSQEAKNK